MSYQVLALKYRPQAFSQVVGQEHVTTTLTNAISGNRVPHAMLLAGPRGTGKTTIARIMAKAMTCENGPTPTPCNTCRICTDIINGHCADVFEIDGASNNSVEQIRELRDNVAYMPAAARYKVYIIDEVHMLSVAAFNALLKTLEEPPDHVLFIFATTEVHKIPATILSRCQRHDLSRILLEKICAHLEKLCDAEGYIVEKEGLELIALEADGSIRDALSLLDRILSAGPEKEISTEMVSQRLRVTDRGQLSAIATAVLSRNGAAIIELISQVNDSGMDLKKFYAGIIAHFRNLNIIALCGPDTPVLNMTASEKQELAHVCTSLSPAYLGVLLDLLLKEENIVRFASHTQTAVEMVLLKMIQIEPETRLDEIITKVDLLARQMEEGLAQAKACSTPLSASGNQNQREPSAPRSIENRQQMQAPPLAPTFDSEPAMAHTSTPAVPPAPQVPQPLPHEATKAGLGQTNQTGQMPPTPSYEQEPGRMQDLDIDDTSSRKDPVYPEESEAGVLPAGVEERSVQPSWPGFMETLQQKLPVIFGLLSKGQADTTRPDHVTVTLSSTSCSGFERHRLESKSQELDALCNTYFKKPIDINIIETKEDTDTAAQQEYTRQQAEKSAEGHPMVQQAIRMFDADIL